MSIQTDLTRIKNAKATIKAYIEGNGLTVPSGTLLDGMASMLESIEAGGGSFDLSNFLQNITDVISFSFTPVKDKADYNINKPSTNSIPRMGFVYTDDISYAYNKSILCFWLYTAVDPYTDVSSGANLQVHIFTSSSSFLAARIKNAFLLQIGNNWGCLSSGKNGNTITIQSQTAANNEAIFKAGIQYNGFVFFGD